ncbi:hypothetical protein V6N12_050519 [Hibiscus sabdariffa]|uniref:Uncharacterized protein n=1 Tax=Hibiscus sabdariffa TaxID=183260 RepID=A0ABR2GCM0_9ROSI
MVYFTSIGCSPLIAKNPAEFLLDLANGNINDISVPSELEDKVHMGNSETETRNDNPPPTIVHEYLVEAYESRVVENDKRKLMTPLLLDEENKLKVSSLKREKGQAGGNFPRGLAIQPLTSTPWFQSPFVRSIIVDLSALSLNLCHHRHRVELVVNSTQKHPSHRPCRTLVATVERAIL